MKSSIYEDNEQNLVREKNAGGGRLIWIEWSGKGSQAGNISADSKDPAMWRIGVMGGPSQERE